MEKFRETIKSNQEKQAEIHSPEFEAEDFEDTKDYFANLVKQLTPAIRNHEYDLVIGDDASGRIPTLVIGGLMKEIYSEDKVKPPEILFLAGKQHRDQEEEAKLDDYLRKIIKKKQIDSEKIDALLVTEYISRGRHAANFLNAFKKAGLSCDVATLSTDNSSTEIYKELPDFKNVEMYVGEPGGKLRFWSRSRLSGVIQVIQAYDEIFAVRSDSRVTPSLNKARADVKRMIEYLKQIYDQERKKIEQK